MVLARRTGSFGKANAGAKTLSHAQVAELYKKHLQQLDSQEKITTNYITDAVRLYKNLLVDATAPCGEGEEGGTDMPHMRRDQCHHYISTT